MISLGGIGDIIIFALAVLVIVIMLAGMFLAVYCIIATAIKPTSRD